MTALYEAGVPLLLGTDLFQGFTLHVELENFVAAGMSPYDAIRAGTVEAARFLGSQEEFGTVGVGRRADLLLVEGNPLDDVKNLAKRTGVMVRGRWLPTSELTARLEAWVASR